MSEHFGYELAREALHRIAAADACFQVDERRATHLRATAQTLADLAGVAAAVEAVSQGSHLAMGRALWMQSMDSQGVTHVDWMDPAKPSPVGED